MMIEKIQDDIYMFKRLLVQAKKNNDELEMKRLKLCIKRRLNRLYEYNIEQLLKLK